jgi:hypothetical protein
MASGGAGSPVSPLYRKHIDASPFTSTGSFSVPGVQVTVRTRPWIVKGTATAFPAAFTCVTTPPPAVLEQPPLLTKH